MIPAPSLKIFTTQEAIKKVENWKQQGQEIVFTNGCFDILHIGHIKYLEEAAALGNKLIVGVNSDASTSRLKGENRPINEAHSRIYLLASLTFVDGVVEFDENTPLALIEALTPDILVKGGDYKAEDVVGGKVVIENGGEVKILQFLEGYSTTNIESKILSLNRFKNLDAEND